VIRAELHVVLNTLTEHGFQDALKKYRSAGKIYYEGKGLL
jgi:hypothetical protein